MDTKPNTTEIIKEQRKKMPLSLENLSKISGVSISHLSRVEQGNRRPSIRILLKIAKPLGFDLQELFVITGYLPSQVDIDTKNIQKIIDRLILSK